LGGARPGAAPGVGDPRNPGDPRAEVSAERRPEPSLDPTTRCAGPHAPPQRRLDPGTAPLHRL